MKNAIQVTQSSMPDFEEYTNEIKELWQSKWLSNNGQKHQKLEQQLRDYLKVSELVLFTNGHLALEIALAALQLEGEVITTPFTFASTTQAIVRNGLTPVFCDINPDDYTIDVNKIEDLITEKTCAILPVHVYGNVCDVEKIAALAQKYQLKVIYDAAHTFGITVDGQGIGTFGDISMFSFHATKVFNTIEGGALTFNDARLKPLLTSLKNFGMTNPEAVDYVAGNAKMNEFQAAMGLCNLKHIEEEIEKREKVAARYLAQLSHLPGIKLSKKRANIKDNYAYFPVVFEGFSKSRNQVFEALKAQNIFARKYFYPLTSSFSCYQGRFTGNTPIAEFIANHVLTLPMYADLPLDEVDRICEIIIELGEKQ